MKRACELCKGMARIHCESDQASLCWDCDAKVHSANFLVARHSRNLLCHVCQAATPWSAAGAKLGPTVSVCAQCVDGRICDDESGGEDEEEEEAAAEEEEEEEEMEENQVVPWSSSPPPSERSLSTEEALSGGEVVVSRKRFRLENASPDHPSDGGHDCSSSDLSIRTPPWDSLASSSDSFSTPPQNIRRTDPDRAGGSGSGILESLRRLRREEMDSSAEMPEIRTLINGPEPSI